MMIQTSDNNFNIDLVEPHEGQKEVLRSKAKYRICATGRRWGKTELSIIASVIRLSKGQSIWFCSPTAENSERVFRHFSRLIRSIPDEYVVVNKTYKRIEFLFSGGVIEFKSLHTPENLRGAGLDFLIMDEAGFVDEEVFTTVLQPMLLTSDGDALFISSPNGKNWFYKYYKMGLDPENENYESFHFTSYDNPLIKPELIDDIRKTTPTMIFEQEYLAEFADDGGSVFRGIEKCIRFGFDEDKLIRDTIKLSREDKNTVVFGIDWAQKNDFTVITVLDLQTNSLITYSRLNQIAWEDIRQEIIDMYNEWQPVYILAEENNATANIEALQKEGLPIEGFWTGSKSKPMIINALSVAIEQGDISLPDDKTLISELSSFEATYTKAGNVRYSAPSGFHDDIVLSLAIAYNLHDTVMKPFEIEVISI